MNQKSKSALLNNRSGEFESLLLLLEALLFCVETLALVFFKDQAVVEKCERVKSLGVSLADVVPTEYFWPGLHIGFRKLLILDAPDLLNEIRLEDQVHWQTFKKGNNFIFIPQSRVFDQQLNKAFHELLILRNHASRIFQVKYFLIFTLYVKVRYIVLVNLLVVNFVTQWSTIRDDLKLIYTHSELFTDLNN